MVQYCKCCGKPRAQSRGQLCVVCELERMELSGRLEVVGVESRRMEAQEGVVFV